MNRYTVTSTNGKQFVANKFCPLRHCTVSQLSALPQTQEERQGHFVVGLKKTKGNVHVTISRVQCTAFTSHINITHTNNMQFHILLIYSHIKAQYCKTH